MIVYLGEVQQSGLATLKVFRVKEKVGDRKLMVQVIGRGSVQEIELTRINAARLSGMLTDWLENGEEAE